MGNPLCIDSLFFGLINLQVCADETRYFLPMSEATRQALFNPLSTSPRDLNRLSPALRKKHLMQLHRKRRTPTTSSHPYDLYIISAPFSNRVSNSTANPGRTLIRSVRSELSNHSTAPPLPFLNTESTTDVKMEKEEEEEENDYAFAKAKPEEMDELETDSDTNSMIDFLNNPGMVPELYKLVSVCSQVVKYYTDLASKQDLSPYIDNLLNIPHNSFPDQPSTSTTISSDNVIVDK